MYLPDPISHLGKLKLSQSNYLGMEDDMSLQHNIIEGLEQEKDYCIDPDLRKQIDYAIQRVRQGVYDYCESCGKRIEYTIRSESMHATHCATCATLDNGSHRESDVEVYSAR